MVGIVSIVFINMGFVGAVISLVVLTAVIALVVLIFIGAIVIVIFIVVSVSTIASVGDSVVVLAAIVVTLVGAVKLKS